MSKANWLDEEVAFYDFIWAYGTKACTNCINREIFNDFAAGGDKFEQMKKKILKKWPTKTAALSAFEGYKLKENSNGSKLH